MTRPSLRTITASASLGLAALAGVAIVASGEPQAMRKPPTVAAERLIAEGRQIFRFDTFGDEQLWTSVLRMHEVIATVSPETALAKGLKVDVDALPADLVALLAAGQVDLSDPAVTVELIRLNAVVGVRGTVSSTAQLTSVGITCALCHSTVDNSFAPATVTLSRRRRDRCSPIRRGVCRCQASTNHPRTNGTTRR